MSEEIKIVEDTLNGVRRQVRWGVSEEGKRIKDIHERMWRWAEARPMPDPQIEVPTPTQHYVWDVHYLLQRVEELERTVELYKENEPGVVARLDEKDRRIRKLVEETNRRGRELEGLLKKLKVIEEEYKALMEDYEKACADAERLEFQKERLLGIVKNLDHSLAKRDEQIAEMARGGGF